MEMYIGIGALFGHTVFVIKTIHVQHGIDIIITSIAVPA